MVLILLYIPGNTWSLNEMVQISDHNQTVPKIYFYLSSNNYPHILGKWGTGMSIEGSTFYVSVCLIITDKRTVNLNSLPPG